MKLLIGIVLTFSLIAIQPPAVIASEPIPVVILKYHYEILMDFLSEDGRNLEDIDSIKAKRQHRILADQVIMAKALKLGGIDPIFRYIPIDNSARERAEVKAGNAVISAQDQWPFNFDDTVFMTRPIIPENTFSKGVFGRSDHAGLMKAHSLDSLQQYSAVYDNKWPEWRIIETLKLKKLYHTATIENMFRMVAGGRVDLTFAEIPNDVDMPRVVDGVELRLVKGIKLVVPASRNFMVSKHHRQGKRVYDALSKGLEILHEQGEIVRHMTEVGIINPAIADWVPLN